MSEGVSPAAHKDPSPLNRLDFIAVNKVIPEKSSVLDIGCGDGTLIGYLRSVRSCKVAGIELREDGVNACVRKGLSVLHGDVDDGLSFYPDKYFDFVLLIKTIQATKRPDFVL